MELFIDIPVANAIRLTEVGKAVDKRASFDQVRFSKASHTTIQDRCYFQPFEQADTLRLQFLTNYPINLVTIRNKVGELAGSGEATVLRQYVGLEYRSDCKVVAYQGKIFIYFEQGAEYTDVDFEVEGDSFDLSGRLPSINAKVGDIVNYSLDGETFQGSLITGIVWNSAVSAEGFLLSADSAISEPVDGYVHIVYDEKPGNLYEYEVDLSALEGLYFVSLAVQLNDEVGKEFLSEPLNISAYHKDTLAIDFKQLGVYKPEDYFQYVYDSGYTRLRFPANHHLLTVGGNIETYSDDAAKLSKTNAVPTRQVTFKGFNLPSWLVDKLNVLMGHDTILLNEYLWQSEDFGSFEIIDRTDIGQYEVVLSQVTDRLIKREVEDVELTASFTPTEVDDVVAAGEAIEFGFESNTPYEFEFLNLPDWITCDKETFSDGDTIELAFAENVLYIPKSIVLIAKADGINLTATIEITQLFEAVEEYLEVSQYEVEFPGAGLSPELTIALDVSASGDWTISQGGYMFTTGKESGGTKLRITVLTDNTDPEERVGTVTLTLDSNPAITKVINVTQPRYLRMVSVDPEVINAPKSFTFAGDAISVVTEPGTSWQATSSHSWIDMNTEIREGSTDISYIILPNNPLSAPPRTGYIYLTNIMNSSDQLTITVNQL